MRDLSIALLIIENSARDILRYCQAINLNQIIATDYIIAMKRLSMVELLYPELSKFCSDARYGYIIGI